MSTSAPYAVVLDVDGTLADSVYLHVRAWMHAFHEVGLEVPSHRLHGAIGMGGDRLVAHVAGDAAESALGDPLRGRHRELFLSMIGDVRPTRGSVELLEELRGRSYALVVASSSDAEMTERLLEAAGVTGLVDEVLTGDDVEHSKPHPEPVERALSRVGAAGGFMLGDAPWDARAATAAGVPCVGVRTGGFAAVDLREAGMVEVWEDPAAVLADLHVLLERVAARR